MVFKPFVNVGTLVLVQTYHEHLVQKARTPATWVPSPAFPVHQEHLPAKKEVLNVPNAPWGIYNLNRNNQHVIQSKPDQSWPKEAPPRSSCHSGLKLTPLLHLDLSHAQPEQLATCHLMNRAKIALLEHPAHPVPPHAKPATKESLTISTAVLVAIV